MGVFRADMKAVQQELEQRIYKWWDESAESGTRTRPRTEQEQPQLTTLRWANGVPELPEQVLNTFPSGSIQHAEVLAMESELKSVWPVSEQQPRPASNSAAPEVPRTPSRPDLANTTVLDISREISLAHISVVGFEVPRFRS